MTDPEHARPGDLVAPLALDAALPLYVLLHVPPDDGSLRLHGFLKEAVEYAHFASDEAALWTAIKSYAESTLTDADRTAWLGWIYSAFSGLHPPDVDLSGWLIALEHFHSAPDAWAGSGMSEDEINAAAALIDRYYLELDEDAFLNAVTACQARPLTEWDKRMHQAYGFVYFDRASGADPFLSLKFINQGEALRRAIRATDIESPAFPAAALRTQAQAVIDQLGVWMPPGRTLGPLADV